MKVLIDTRDLWTMANCLSDSQLRKMITKLSFYEIDEDPDMDGEMRPLWFNIKEDIKVCKSMQEESRKRTEEFLKGIWKKRGII